MSCIKIFFKSIWFVVVFSDLPLCFALQGHCSCRLGQHLHTWTCLHANDTQTAGSLTAASAIFNFRFSFLSSLHIHILPAVDCMKMSRSKLTAERKVDSENCQFKKNGLKYLHSFSLQPAQDPCAYSSCRTLTHILQTLAHCVKTHRLN